MQYQLIDLDLNDGITPSLVISSIDRSLFVSVNENRNHYYDESRAVGAVSLHLPFASTSASATGDAVSADVDLTPPFGESGAVARAYVHQYFTLTPNTGVTWTAQGMFSAEHTSGGEAAASIALIGWLDDADPSAQPYQSFTDRYTMHSGADAYLLQGHAQSHHASVGMVGIYAEVHNIYFDYVPPPVPEPATWGMLGAGLLLVGAARRRKAVPA